MTDSPRTCLPRRFGPALVILSLAPLGVSAQEVCDAPWALEPVLRIGSVDGDDALSHVNDLDVGPEGNLYVAQSFVPRVVVFTPDGRLSRTIGRAGSGPGEFDIAPIELGWQADTLWVADQSKTHLFASDGTVIRQVRFDAPFREQGSRFSPGAPLADGTYLGRRSLYGSISSYFRSTHLDVPRFTSSGEVVDAPLTVRQRPSIQIDGAFSLHPLDDMLFASLLPYAVTPDGTAFVTVDDAEEGRDRGVFRLMKVSITSDTLFSRDIPFEPLPVSGSDRAWLTDAFGAYHAGDFDGSERALTALDDAARERKRRAARGAIDFPDQFPPVRQIIAGHDDTVWLLREMTLPEMVDRWEVYDETGQLEGVVQIRDGRGGPLPWHPRLNVLRATRDEIWGTTVDELGVPYIHRYRVQRTCD